VHIAVVTDQFLPLVGGVATVTHQLSTHLAARGHQVWVIAPSEDWKNDQHLEEYVQIYRFSSFAWPFYEGQRVALLPFIGLWQLFEKIKPDVVHIHSPQVLGTLARLVAHALRIPVVVTHHFMPINLSRSLADDRLVGRGFSRAVYRYLVRFYQGCEYVTAPTKTAYHMLVVHGLRTQGEVVSNGIDLTRFSTGPGDETVRRALRLPADQPLALTVTRLMSEKRVHVLLAALAQVQRPIHLAIAGTGPDAGTLQALAKRLGISHQVTFLGFVPDEHLVSLYRLGDFFVMPSIAELQSLATLEAMACGLPVIAAEAGALPELVQPEQNGYLFPPDQSEQLAQCLDRLLCQPRQWQAMGQKSLEIASRHDYQQVIGKWEAIYQDLHSLAPLKQQGKPWIKKAK
jgi:glycosyltransferase involved in cell wall biosynthesis